MRRGSTPWLAMASKCPMMGGTCSHQSSMSSTICPRSKIGKLPFTTPSNAVLELAATKPAIWCCPSLKGRLASTEHNPVHKCNFVTSLSDDRIRIRIRIRIRFDSAIRTIWVTIRGGDGCCQARKHRPTSFLQERMWTSFRIECGRGIRIRHLSRCRMLQKTKMQREIHQ